ncbi:unnamed protein product [Pleuronectes platessa]|uniref:Uncharacterized protein n=1 Tax=Pleuronectes platessa TaxID=8262 RepID=A0A9N7TU94_PLEPL|nr:unnamed protein product [Pleuronectes platessa]
MPSETTVTRTQKEAEVEHNTEISPEYSFAVFFPRLCRPTLVRSHHTGTVAQCVCGACTRGSWHVVLGWWDSCWQSRFTVFSPFGFNSSSPADRYSIPSPPPQLHLL